MNRCRVSTNNPVRRRLFSTSDSNEQARIENFSNILEEQVLVENVEKSKKWNFDFVNGLPLEGTYEWVPYHNSWIGRLKEKDDKLISDGHTEIQEDYNDVHTEIEEECSEQKMNDKTPKISKEGDSVPVLRKRKREDTNEGRTENGVRRLIHFE